jgi:hypothetical protein
MALAPSADGKLLVSAGRDQTIAAWSLADWPSHPELGARFVEKDGKILIRSVDPGSPAWEASGTGPRDNGLAEGDEVLLFAFNINEFLYDPHDMISRTERQQRRIDRIGQSAEECLERLRNPVPGKQFYFRVKREGQSKPWVELQTTVRQRPLWRFFPMRNGEWVLWRWRDYYYETSTHGDRFIGWQVSGDIGDTPQFYRADQYRKLFHRPEKIRAVLPPQWGEDPERVIFADVEAPEVRLTTGAGQKEVAVKDAPVQVNLTAAARNADIQQPVVRAVLWVNDYLFFKLDNPPQGKVQQDLTIPEEVLQQGDNTLTLQAFNQAGGREEKTVRVHYTSSRRGPGRTLFGLAVGINDYKKVKNLKTRPGGDLSLDYARQDAEAMQKAWKRQENNRLYQKAQVDLLPENRVTPRAILDQLAKMKNVVKPDDHFLLFLAGHGLLAEKNNPDSFVYLTPDSDGLHLKQTALSSAALLEALANLKCRKFILVDACRSGGLAANSVRNFDPDGVGIAILAACKANQESKEIFDLKHGAFTRAVLNVLEDKEEFNRADRDQNGQLDFKELCEYVEKEVPNLIEDQNPEFGPMPMIRFFVAAKTFKP